MHIYQLLVTYESGVTVTEAVFYSICPHLMGIMQLSDRNTFVMTAHLYLVPQFRRAFALLNSPCGAGPPHDRKVRASKLKRRLVPTRFKQHFRAAYPTTKQPGYVSSAKITGKFRSLSGGRLAQPSNAFVIEHH